MHVDVVLHMEYNGTPDYEHAKGKVIADDLVMIATDDELIFRKYYARSGATVHCDIMTSSAMAVDIYRLHDKDTSALVEAVNGEMSLAEFIRKAIDYKTEKGGANK